MKYLMNSSPIAFSAIFVNQMKKVMLEDEKTLLLWWIFFNLWTTKCGGHLEF